MDPRAFPQAPPGETYLKAAPADPLRDFSETVANVLKGFGGFQGQGTAHNVGQNLQLPISLLSAVGIPAKGDVSAKFNALVKAAQQGSTQAREELLQNMSKILWSVANRYGRSERTGGVTGKPGMHRVESQVSSQDLYNRGAEEIFKNLPKYEEGAKSFSSWVYPKVVGSMRGEALGARTPIAVSPDVLAAMRKIDAAEGRLRTLHGPDREFTLDELAAAAKLKPDIVARIKSGQIHSMPKASSLDQMLTSERDPGGFNSAIDRAMLNPDPGMSQYSSQMPQPGARLIQHEAFGELKDIFRNLPANMKTILEKTLVEGKDAKTAAKELGIPVSTYYRQQKAAQDFWQQAVQKHQGNISGGAPAEAKWANFQQGFGTVPSFHNYHLAEDFKDPKSGKVYPRGTTLSEDMLKEFGIPFEKPPAPGTAPVRELPLISGGSSNLGPPPGHKHWEGFPATEKTVNLPRPFQEYLREGSNERVDRLNQANQRWGIPPIQGETSMAPLSPMSQDPGRPVGMKGLADAKSAAEQAQIIRDLLSGGKGDIRSPYSFYQDRRDLSRPFDLMPGPVNLGPAPQSLGAAAASSGPAGPYKFWDPENLKPLVKPTTKPYKSPLSQNEPVGNLPHQPETVDYPLHLFGQQTPEGPALGHNPDALRHGELVQRLRGILDAVNMSSGRN